MDDLRRFLPDATPEQIASAERGDEAGRRIKQETWANAPEPRPRLVGHDYDVLDDNNVAHPVGLGTWSVWFEHQSNIAEQGGVSRRIVSQTKVGP